MLTHKPAMVLNVHHLSQTVISVMLAVFRAPLLRYQPVNSLQAVVQPFVILRILNASLNVNLLMVPGLMIMMPVALLQMKFLMLILRATRRGRVL